ncbi:hypothetical protein GCK32_005708 [Trichostrongylus colubriformis]|uniref:Uncharacterized protein n=1 Tax=Trichostrongylus colubriformis TaxID=6319 RepID=A0AAN8FKV0_TRICO
MMMLIALTVLVGSVHSAQYCRYNGFKEQPFKRITNPNLRTLLQDKIKSITNTDCTLSYQVNTNDGRKAFYPFRVDSGNLIFYGIVTVDHRNKFMWNGCTKEQFEEYLKSCYSDDMPGKAPPIVPPVLSCKKRRVHFESICQWSKLDLQPIREINNAALRSLLHQALWIGDSDCTLSYRVTKNDNGKTFYPFRIDQGETSFYGIVKMTKGGNLVWKPTDKKSFEKYLDNCDNEHVPASQRPDIPPVLSCGRTRQAPIFFRE